jgi:uncharacterized protein
MPAGTSVTSRRVDGAERSLDVTVLAGTLAVCRLPSGTGWPAWLEPAPLASVTSTPYETSVVCRAAVVPEGVRAERGWRAIHVAGTLDFGLTGVLSSLTRPLAAAGVSVFAISTFDTDYLLVAETSLDDAIAALTRAGHRVG